MEGLPQTSDSTGIVDPESLKEIQQRDGEVNETQTELDSNEEKGEAECNKDNVITKEDNTRGGEDAQTTEKASTDQTTDNSGSTDKAEDGRNQNAVDNGNSLLAQAPLVHPETSSGGFSV